MKGEALKDTLFDHVYVSDLKRTRDTFNNIHKNITTKIKNIHFEPLIREKSGGILEGKPLKTFQQNA